MEKFRDGPLKKCLTFFKIQKDFFKKGLTLLLGIARMGLHVEYAHHLLNELQDLPKAQIETLHFTPWLEAMRSAADRFEAINMQKSAEDATKIIGIARTQRRHAEEPFRSLNMKVNALYATTQSAHYKQYIDTVNTYIADARALIKSRKTRKENAQRTENSEQEEK